MKSKKNIKSIIIVAVMLVLSLMFLNMSLAVNNAKVIVETANLRETTSEESKVLAQMSKSEEVEIIEKSDDWYKVKYKNITGYTKSNLLSANKETQNIVENTTNNTLENSIANTQTNSEETQEITQPKEEVKNEIELGKYKVIVDTKIKLVPLINATDMTELKKEKEITVVKTMNGWAYVEFDTIRGWIRLENIKSETQLKEEEKIAAQETKIAAELAKKQAEANVKAIKTSYVKSETINLRKENTTSSEIIGNLPQNKAVEVLSEESGWSKCRVSGLIGYIKSEYLSSNKTEKVEKQETSRATPQPRQSNNEIVTKEEPASADTSSVILYAKQFLGSSYVYGGNGPNAFDCSGYTSYVYKKFGVSLNRTAGGQLRNGVEVTNLESGDLVMFGTSSTNITHVGIYMGGDTFIHAANKSRGVTTDRLSTYKNYYGARRVL